nr:hypothetical protein K-LCC10_0276 [Kaumoebavirus]
MNRNVRNLLLTQFPNDIIGEIEYQLIALYRRDHQIKFKTLWQEVKRSDYGYGIPNIYFFSKMRIDFVYNECVYCHEPICSRCHDGKWLSSSHNSSCWQWYQSNEVWLQNCARGNLSDGRSIFETPYILEALELRPYVTPRKI